MIFKGESLLIWSQILCIIFSMSSCGPICSNCCYCNNMISIFSDYTRLKTINIDGNWVSCEANTIICFYIINSAIQVIGITLSESIISECEFIISIVVWIIARHIICCIYSETKHPSSIFLGGEFGFYEICKRCCSHFHNLCINWINT